MVPYSISHSQKVQLRRDTSSNWTTGNPILLSGEMGFETNTTKFKIGNGSTPWNSLAYSPVVDAGSVPTLGVDTNGNYVAGVSAGTGITVTHVPSEGSTATVAINATLDNLSNVNVPSPTNGHFLKYVSSASEWQSASVPTINNLNDIGDVTITAVVSGQILKWNGTQWINDTPSAGGAAINSLDDVADVTITSASNGQFLKWNGSVWVNDAIDLGTDTTGNYVASLTAGTGITLTNNSGETATPTIAIGQAVATNSNVTFNDLTVSGNLTVSGTTTSINTETLTVDDNIVVLNNNVTASPTENAGIEVERGTSANVAIRWNETSDVWEITNDGTTYSDIATATSVSTTTGALTVDNLYDVNFTTSPTNGQFLKYVSASSSWIAESVTSIDDIGDVTITTPSAGQRLQWNGTAWINVTPQSDATNTTVDAVGDLLIGSANDTLARLAIGANEFVLTSNGTTASWNKIPNENDQIILASRVFG